MNRSQVRRQIEDGLSGLGLGREGDLADRLTDYLDLLGRWNEAYNLTAVRRPEDMVSRHLMDSLAIVPFLGVGRVLDVGTGAGLPGLVLAMACPGQRYVLLDSSGKKTRFLQHAIGRLGIGNAEVVRARAEEHGDKEGFGVVVSRAFSSLDAFAGCAGHLLAPGGRLLAMKGAVPEDELAALPAGWRLLGIHRLDVPGLDGVRHVIELGREEDRT